MELADKRLKFRAPHRDENSEMVQDAKISVAGGRLWANGICFPPPHDDESLYSWCTRYHLINVGVDPRATSQVLFGHPRAGLRYDLPFHLINFQRATNNRLGSLRDILINRTILGFHSPFLPTDIEEQIISYLSCGESAKARSLLGLKRSGQAIVNPLKACPACVIEQVSNHGYSWWKTSQQWASVLVCDIHEEYLRIAKPPTSQRVAQDFYLPHTLPQDCWLQHKHTTISQRKQLSRIGDWSRILIGRRATRLTDSTLRQCYLAQAMEHGWVSFKGEVRQQQLREAFIDYYREIIELLDNDFIGDIEREKEKYLAFLFRKRPSRRFPLKHILLLNFLFKEADELFAYTAKLAKASNSDTAMPF